MAKLYSNFISSCSWRVRIALKFKQIDYETVPINLHKGEQKNVEFVKINPMGQVPLLVIDGNTISESIAMLEYLEETRKDKPLLPSDPAKRAKVREICSLIGSGIQPLQNPAVAKKASSDPATQQQWAHDYISRGFDALEKILDKSAGKYSVGDAFTMADCCLAPQFYNAKDRFGVNVELYPTINRIGSELLKHPAVAATHPSVEKDAPK